MEAVGVRPDQLRLVAEIVSEAGLPPGVLNVVQGFGDVGAAVVEHDDVKGMFFTGSTETGERIAINGGAQAAAARAWR